MAPQRRGLPALAARELVHDINKRVEASVRVGPRFGEFADAPVGFFAMVRERHCHVYQLAYHPYRVGLAVFEQLDVRGKLRLLLDDETHPRFDAVGHGGIIA